MKIKKFAFLLYAVGGILAILSLQLNDFPSWKVILIAMATLSILIGWETARDCPIGLVSILLLASFAFGVPQPIAPLGRALIVLGIYRTIIDFKK